MKTIIEKVWGHEEWIVNNAIYCGKLLHVKQGWRCSLHYHKIKHETFYIMQGKVFMEWDCMLLQMLPSESLIIPPGVRHRFTGLEDSIIVEFSTTHSDSDVYRDEESGYVGCNFGTLTESTSF